MKLEITIDLDKEQEQLLTIIKKENGEFYSSQLNYKLIFLKHQEYWSFGNLIILLALLEEFLSHYLL